MSAADDKRAALISGLRDLANFLDQHPEVPIPSSPYVNIPVDLDEVESVAKVLGKVAEEHWARELGRLHSVQVCQEFGSVEVKWYAMDPGAQAEYQAQRELVRAAVWILVCDAGHLPTSTTYATEQAARQVLAMHAAACTGGHTVHLVSPAPTGELVQA